MNFKNTYVLDTSFLLALNMKHFWAKMSLEKIISEDEKTIIIPNEVKEEIEKFIDTQKLDSDLNIPFLDKNDNLEKILNNSSSKEVIDFISELFFPNKKGIKMIKKNRPILNLGKTDKKLIEICLEIARNDENNQVFLLSADTSLIDEIKLAREDSLYKSSNLDFYSPFKIPKLNSNKIKYIADKKILSKLLEEKDFFNKRYFLCILENEVLIENNLYTMIFDVINIPKEEKLPQIAQVSYIPFVVWKDFKISEKTDKKKLLSNISEKTLTKNDLCFSFPNFAYFFQTFSKEFFITNLNKPMTSSQVLLLKKARDPINAMNYLSRNKYYFRINGDNFATIENEGLIRKYLNINTYERLNRKREEIREYNLV